MLLLEQQQAIALEYSQDAPDDCSPKEGHQQDSCLGLWLKGIHPDPKEQFCQVGSIVDKVQWNHGQILIQECSFQDPGAAKEKKPITNIESCFRKKEGRTVQACVLELVHERPQGKYADCGADGNRYQRKPFGQKEKYRDTDDGDGNLKIRNKKIHAQLSRQYDEQTEKEDFPQCFFHDIPQSTIIFYT